MIFVSGGSNSSFTWDVEIYDPEPVLGTAHRFILTNQPGKAAAAAKDITRKQLEKAMTPPDSRKASDSSQKSEEGPEDSNQEDIQEEEEPEEEEEEAPAPKKSKKGRRFSLKRLIPKGHK